jgi:hypothetical protein
VQTLSLGEGLAVLALPGEFFVETAEVIRAAAAQGWGLEPQGTDLLVACYANDYIGYVIPPEAYEEGGYEAGITFCAPEAEGMFVEASLGVLREVVGGSGVSRERGEPHSGFLERINGSAKRRR